VPISALTLTTQWCEAWIGSGAPVRAHDIRAGAALAVAGLRRRATRSSATLRTSPAGCTGFAAKLRGAGTEIDVHP